MRTITSQHVYMGPLPLQGIPVICCFQLILFHAEHGEQPLEGILPVGTGICKPALFVLPFGQRTVVEYLLCSGVMVSGAFGISMD